MNKLLAARLWPAAAPPNPYKLLFHLTRMTKQLAIQTIDGTGIATRDNVRQIWAAFKHTFLFRSRCLPRKC